MEYKYSQIFKWKSGKPVKTCDGVIPVYGSNGVIGFCNNAKYKNRIIIGRVGAYCGSVTYCSGEFNATDNTLITECDESKIIYKYAYYALRLAKLNDYAGGSAQPLITQAILSHLKCNIPTIEIQDKVADILSAYDVLIENNNKRIKLLEQMAENLYKEWFVRFRFPNYQNTEFENGIPNGWKVENLDDFGITLDTGSRPSGGIDDSLCNGVPSLGAEAIKELAEFDYSSVKYVPIEYYEKMKRGKFDGNAILLYKDGAYIGKTTIFRNGFPFVKFAVNEHVFLIKANNFAYQNYLYFTLHQKEYFYTMQNLNRNAAQPGLSQPDIKRVKIVVPVESVVEKYNQIIEPLLDVVFQLAKINRNLIKQRDMLLPRLMSGKLEVRHG